MKNFVKIMVFGTFDILHKGHLNFFKQARKLSKHPFLIVSVARDINVKKIKGKKPYHSQSERLNLVKQLKYVNKAVLGAKTDYIGHILKYRPAIIGLGYDQKAYTGNLHRLLKKAGLRVKIQRLKAFLPKKYKSSALRRVLL